MRKFLLKCEGCGSTRQSMPDMTSTICPDCGKERKFNRVVEDQPNKTPIYADATSPNLEELREKFGIKNHKESQEQVESNSEKHDTMVSVEHVPGDNRFKKVAIIDNSGVVIGEQG